MARWVRFWPAPLDPYVKAPGGLYGPPSLTGRGAFHNGVDVAMPEGTPVLAPEAGVVRWVDRIDDDASGLHVGVEHADGVVTSYAHLSRVDVMPGQPVEQYAQLGLSGNTGTSTGPHVHFRVRTPQASSVDPLQGWLVRPRIVGELPNGLVLPLALFALAVLS